VINEHKIKGYHYGNTIEFKVGKTTTN